MRKLYLVVVDFSAYGEKQEAEWFHFVSDNELMITSEAERKAREHIEQELELDNFKIENVFLNTVFHVDGYKIKVTR